MYEISGDGYTQAQTVSSKVEVALASRIKNVMRDTVQVITAFVGHEEDEVLSAPEIHLRSQRL